jgi:predicted DNA-binding transcriptional regulator
MEPLKNIGLSNEQIAIYQVLLEYGKLPASTLASKSSISRVITYKILDQLIALGIVTKLEQVKAVAVFSPADPENLKKLVDMKKQELVTLETNCDAAISLLKPQFNILRDKPGIRFYEGPEGVQKVLEDSLFAEEIIYSYADIDAIDLRIPEINKVYGEKRAKLGIHKKGILPDTPHARELLKDYHSAITEAKLIKFPIESFPAVMQIYDGKVSYITFSDKDMIGTIIENKNIYQMHKALFEYLWSITPSLSLSSETSPSQEPQTTA